MPINYDPYEQRSSVFQSMTPEQYARMWDQYDTDIQAYRSDMMQRRSAGLSGNDLVKPSPNPLIGAAPAPAAGASPASPAPTPSAAPIPSPSPNAPSGLGTWYQNYTSDSAPSPTQTQGYTAAQASATPWDVTDNQTVAGNVNALIGENSPLMQRAASQADAEMNARGLINSNMAVGAAQGALYDKALQIATPDAATRARAGEFNAGQSTNVNLANTAATNRAGEFTAGAANTGALADTSARTSLGTALIGAESAKYGTDVNAGTQRYTTDVNAATSRYGTDVDAGTARYTADLGAKTQLGVAGINANTQMGVANLNAATQQSIANLNSQTQQTIASLNNQNQLAVTDLNNQNQLLINSSNNATSVYNQTVAAISTIQNNAAMDEATKQTAVESAIALANEQFRVIGSVANLDLGTLLDFGAATPPAPAPAPAEPAPNNWTEPGGAGA